MTLSLFALGLALVAAVDVASPPPAAASMVVEARGDRLTVRARDVSLRLVLERIGDVAQIKVHIDGPAEEPVTVDVRDASPEDALRQILRHRSTVLTYEALAGPLVAMRVVRPAPPNDSLGLADPEGVDAAAGGDHDTGGAGGAEGEPVDPGAAVDVVEDEVLALPGGGESLNVFRFLDRLNDPEPSVRLAALQWLVTRPEARLTALASALKDGDSAVRGAAVQMLLDREVSEEAAQHVMAAAETADPTTIVGLLHRLLTF